MPMVAPASSMSEQQLRLLVEDVANQLCQAVDGKFDFTVKIEVQDETLQKLQLLVNFVLDAARRSLAEFERQRKALEDEIVERKRAEREREALHKQLLDVSHQAGMAEVATGVLHNVGNVLNSVNVSATLVREKVRKSQVADLTEITALMRERADDLGTFMTTDEKGKLVPRYLLELGKHLVDEQTAMLDELESLTRNVEHIKDIVSMQQSYAKVFGVTEEVSPADLVEDALRVNNAGLVRHKVQVVREYGQTPTVLIDKNKVLQILVNLISNAKYALDHGDKGERLLTLRIGMSGDDEGHVRIEVIDNGVGIPEQNLTRIFSHGFSTKSGGHGFGLHSASLAAKEVGGTLTTHSEGPGKGATFTLEIPPKPAEVA